MSWKNYYTGEAMHEKDIISGHNDFLEVCSYAGKEQEYKVMVKDGYFKICVLDWEEEGWEDSNIKLPKE